LAGWTKDGDKWVIKTAARTRDGKKVPATNTVTRTVMTVVLLNHAGRLRGAASAPTASALLSGEGKQGPGLPSLE
jgi:hypothetical protein